MKNDKPFVPLLIERQVGETQLFVKEVKIEGKRYIVCRNESEAENDRQEPKRIVAALDAQLKKGDKALIGNSAYRRYLRKTRGTKDTPASRSMLASSPRRPASMASSFCVPMPR
jgi:hypothetical protein